MKKNIILITILMISLSKSSLAQYYTDNDKKMWFYDFINDTIIKVYYNSAGGTTSKSCADFYRIAELDRHYFMFIGEVKDYYPDSTPMFKGVINKQGFYYGKCIYYYRNGKIREEGIMRNGIRDSIWNYFYPIGKIKKKMRFDHNKANLLEFFSKNGKQTVINGTGDFKDNLRISKNSDYETIISGHVKNGDFDGKWTFTNSYFGTVDGEEYYENGSFIKGISKAYNGENKYFSNPKATFNEYITQEKLNIYQYRIGCPGYTINSLPSYKNDYSLVRMFCPELINSITTKVNVKEVENQWFIVSFNINKQKQLNNLKIKSSLNNEVLSQKLKDILSSMTDWTNGGEINGSYINFPIYLPIVFENGNLIIPMYHLF